MAQSILSPVPPTYTSYLEDDWQLKELRLRIEFNVANREAWRILRDQSDSVMAWILLALDRYAVTWVPPEAQFDENLDEDDSDLGDVPFKTENMIELYNTAEHDFEKGLLFISEVEKGSHLKASTIPKFRPEALKAYCELVESKIEELEPDDEEDDSEGDDEPEIADLESQLASLSASDANAQEQPEHSSRPGNRSAPMSYEEFLAEEAAEDAEEHEKRKDFLSKVYQNLEEQFKSRLQSLVHQHRTTEKKATKK